MSTLAAWLLVALWLPGILHCAAETAGVIGLSGCCDEAAAPGSSDGHRDDGHCAVFEAGVPREDYDSASLSVPPAALLEVLRMLRFVAVVAGDNGVSPVAAAPPELAQCWRSVERMVAFARAP